MRRLRMKGTPITHSANLPISKIFNPELTALIKLL
jgi:hypothetical protein